MSERILKLLNQETALNTTPTTLGNAQLVRVRNSTAAEVYSIIVKDAGTITGSITIYGGEVLFIRKKAAETIESTALDTDIRIVSVAFGD